MNKSQNLLSVKIAVFTAQLEYTVKCFRDLKPHLLLFSPFFKFFQA